MQSKEFINKENGITMVTVIVMVVVITIISVMSIISSKTIFKESKEEALKQNKFAVETAVSKYAAKAATSGVLTPANVPLPGLQNPEFEKLSGDSEENYEKIKVGVGKDWYLLRKDELESIGVTYIDENYLVNYKKNIVIPLSTSEDVFSLVEYYEQNEQ